MGATVQGRTPPNPNPPPPPPTEPPPQPAPQTGANDPTPVPEIRTPGINPGTVDEQRPPVTTTTGQPPGQGELPRLELPILMPTYQRTVLDPQDDTEPQNNRNNEDRDRYRQDRNYNDNRSNLRRGVIRDYLQQNLQNTIRESRVAINDPLGLQQLTRIVADQLSRTLSDPLMVTSKVLTTIEREITNLLRSDFNHTNGRSSPVTYDRAIQISELLLKYIPNDLSKQFKDVTPQKMLDGMILLQLWAGPGGCLDDVQRITNCKPSILPDGMVWANFRDTGLLVAMLLKNAASLNDRNSLDIAVQRFVKLLVAKGELGILLAAIQLTAEARSGRMALSRVAALVQIYELIGQLVRNAERAMKEAAPPKPAELARTDRGLAFSAALESNEAEAALRQYLAFNPAAKADAGASAFFSEQLAETSARIAVDSSQREIVEWLGSGRHRFVTEFDLGKPLGIVIDRVSDVCFTASQIRVVLVRDGSVLGWHILRSSLVG